MNEDTISLFAKHVAEQAGHELMIVRKVDANELVAMVHDFMTRCDEDNRSDYAGARCRYCGSEESKPDNDCETLHEGGYLCARAEALLARLEAGDDN